MGPGPEGPMGSMGPEMGPPVMNGMSSAGKKWPNKLKIITFPLKTLFKNYFNN